jgi:hypothetical protein
VRGFLAVSAAIALLLAGCGGDGDKNAGAGSSGPTQQGARSGQSSGATGARGGGSSKRGSSERGRSKGRSNARIKLPKGSNNIFFFKARQRCLTVPTPILASLYQAKSSRPRDVARAYAKREASTSTSRHAAIAGCLAGIRSRR